MTSKDFILTTIKSNKPAISKLGIRDIGLFGSYVRGDQSDKSDIDILIDFEPNEENYDNYMVYDLFEQLFKNERVEIITKRVKSIYRTENFKRGFVCLKSQ